MASSWPIKYTKGAEPCKRKKGDEPKRRKEMKKWNSMKRKRDQCAHLISNDLIKRHDCNTTKKQT